MSTGLEVVAIDGLLVPACPPDDVGHANRGQVAGSDAIVRDGARPDRPVQVVVLVLLRCVVGDDRNEAPRPEVGLLVGRRGTRNEFAQALQEGRGIRLPVAEGVDVAQEAQDRRRVRSSEPHGARIMRPRVARVNTPIGEWAAAAGRSMLDLQLMHAQWRAAGWRRGRCAPSGG